MDPNPETLVARLFEQLELLRLDRFSIIEKFMEEGQMRREILEYELEEFFNRLNRDCERSGESFFHWVVQLPGSQLSRLTPFVRVLLDARKFNVDVNVRNADGDTPFQKALADENIDMVTQFLRHPEKINVGLENGSGKSSIELAHDMIAHDKKYEQIEAELSSTEAGKRYMDNLYRDRQVYVDAANAILVGAALIASVTFAAWLQPPLNYTLSGDSYSTIDPYPPSTYPNYADVEHNIGLGVFWIFNSLSFYFAIGTVVLGACSVLPRRKFFIKQSVVKLRRNLLWTSSLLALSVLFVLVAFGTAGVIVLMPVFKFRLYMIVPSTIGGLVCLISLGYLFCNILEESSWRNAKNGGNRRTSKENIVSEKMEDGSNKMEPKRDDGSKEMKSVKKEDVSNEVDDKT